MWAAGPSQGLPLLLNVCLCQEQPLEWPVLLRTDGPLTAKSAAGHERRDSDALEVVGAQWLAQISPPIGTPVRDQVEIGNQVLKFW